MEIGSVISQLLRSSRNVENGLGETFARGRMGDENDGRNMKGVYEGGKKGSSLNLSSNTELYSHILDTSVRAH